MVDLGVVVAVVRGVGRFHEGRGALPRRAAGGQVDVADRGGIVPLEANVDAVLWVERGKV